MKTIQKPAPLVFGEGQEVSFENFVRHLVDNDTRFNADGKGIRSAMRIENALREATGDSFRLDDEDAKLLIQVAEAPTAGYGIRPARLCLPFIDAIVK